MFKPLKDTLSHVAEPFSSLKEWSQDGMQKRSHVNVLFLLLFFIAWWHVPFSLNVLFYRVYEFREGSIEDRHHLGLKGAYLCEIAKYATHSWDVLGLIALMLSPTIPSIHHHEHCWCFRQHLPVPAGFIVHLRHVKTSFHYRGVLDYLHIYSTIFIKLWQKSKRRQAKASRTLLCRSLSHPPRPTWPLVCQRCHPRCCCLCAPPPEWTIPVWRTPFWTWASTIRLVSCWPSTPTTLCKNVVLLWELHFCVVACVWETKHYY